MLKTDVIPEGGIFYLNHPVPQGFCPLQRTTFYIVSLTIRSYLCVNVSIHIPKNTQSKCFSEISQLCHTSKDLRTFWTWDLLVAPCWLWEYLKNWCQQTVFRQSQVMCVTQSCMLVFPEKSLLLKCPKQLFRNTILEESRSVFQTHYFLILFCEPTCI